MNVLVGDSRVASLKHLHLRQAFEDIWSRPGSSYIKCTKLVEKNLILHHPPLTSEIPHYYILAGICEVTTMLKEGRYNEVIFESTPDVIDRIKELLKSNLESINKLGAVAIFCTIPVMHLEKWNNIRLKQNKTSHLKYTTQYDTMQKSLEITLNSINEFIVELNTNRNLATPLLHTVLQRQKRHKTYNLYKMLVDGCHPGEDMAKKNGKKPNQSNKAQQ